MLNLPIASHIWFKAHRKPTVCTRCYTLRTTTPKILQRRPILSTSILCAPRTIPSELFDPRSIPIKIPAMVKPTSFRWTCCCCRISIHAMERHSFGKPSESIRKIRGTARSRREASSSALPISAPMSGLGQDCRDWNQNPDFFRYTAGRFLFEERYQMACRYVRFDMNELVRIAASSIASRLCVAVRKLPEGQYSKAFLFTMDDGKRVVAKVPNPNAGRPHYTTASEVATMDFVSILLYYGIEGLTLSLRLGRFSNYLHPRYTHGIRKLRTVQSGQNSL